MLRVLVFGVMLLVVTDAFRLKSPARKMKKALSIFTDKTVVKRSKRHLNMEEHESFDDHFHAPQILDTDCRDKEMKKPEDSRDIPRCMWCEIAPGLRFRVYDDYYEGSMGDKCVSCGPCSIFSGAECTTRPKPPRGGCRRQKRSIFLRNGRK